MARRHCRVRKLAPATGAAARVQDEAKSSLDACTALKGENAALTEESESLRLKYLQTRAQLAEVKTAKLEQAAADSAKNEMTSTRVDELEAALGAYKDRERKLQARVAEAEATEAELSDTVEKLSDKISEMRAENESVAALLAAQRRDLDRVLAEEVETEGVLTATQQRLREWQARAQELEGQFVDASRSHADDAKRSAGDWAAERKRLQTALSELRHENAVLSSQAMSGGERSGELAALLQRTRSDAAEATAAQRRAEGRAADAEAEVSHLTAALVKARTEATGLTAHVAALRDEVATSQLQAELAGQRVGQSAETARGATRSAQDAALRVAELEGDVEALTASLAGAEDKRARAEAKLAASGLLAEGAQETLDSAVGRATQAQLTAQLLRERLAGETAAREAAQAEVSTLLAQLQQLQTELAGQKAMVTAYTKQVNDLRWSSVLNARAGADAAKAALPAAHPALRAPAGGEAKEDTAHAAQFYASRSTRRVPPARLYGSVGSTPPNGSHALKAAVLGSSAPPGGPEWDPTTERARLAAYATDLAATISPSGQHLPSSAASRSLGGHTLPPPSPVPSSRVPFRSALGRALASGTLPRRAPPTPTRVQEVP